MVADVVVRNVIGIKLKAVNVLPTVAQVARDHELIVVSEATDAAGHPVLVVLRLILQQAG